METVKERPKEALQIWTIYDKHHTESPSYNATLFNIRPDGTTYAIATLWGNLEKLREEMENRGLCRMDRDPDDDPSVVESWL